MCPYSNNEQTQATNFYNYDVGTSFKRQHSNKLDEETYLSDDIFSDDGETAANITGNELLNRSPTDNRTKAQGFSGGPLLLKRTSSSKK